MTAINKSTPAIVQQAQAPKKETTLDKMQHGVKEATKDGTFVGDHLALVGAGSLVGTVATVSAVAKLADAVPAVEKALKFTFVDNGLLVGGALAGATSAVLAEDAIASYQEGDKGKAAGLGAGALITGLGAAELVGRQFDIPVLNQALSTPIKKMYEHGQAIVGAGLAAGGVAVAKSGLEDLQEGKSVAGGAKVLGGSLATLGGIELIGRQYNIPVAKELLSKPAGWVADNSKAVTGGIAMAGGAFAIKEGVDNLKEGNKWLGGAELAGGTVGVLGGAELIGRNFNIAYLDQALTGPAKALFTSKGGILASGGAIALSGVGAGADGVRRLTTQTGILNDAIGAAEVTAAVAGTTGGASLIGYATGNARMAGAFKDNLPILGGVALMGAASAGAKYTAQDIKENGFGLEHVITGTASAGAALAGTQLIADRMGIPVLDQALEKGWKPLAAVGLGAATYKLGEITVKQGSKMMDDITWGNGLMTAGAAAGTVLAGAGTVALAGNVLGIPVMEKAGMKVISGVQTGAVKTAEVAMDKIIEPVFSFAVKNPVVTLGALAVAGGAGYYAYHRNQQAEEATAAASQK